MRDPMYQIRNIPKRPTSPEWLDHPTRNISKDSSRKPELF
jgi:hypothetical protein